MPAYKKQMAEKFLELKIEKLAGLGDGAGFNEGRKIFVPYSVPGDVLNIKLVKHTADASFGAIQEIVSPGKERIKPVCRHFTQCGGCTLQQLSNDAYENFKLTMAQEAVRKAGFDMACVANLIRLPAAFRRRADLKVENGKIGFFAEGSHSLVDIEECKVLEEKLLDLVLQIKKQLSAFPEITAVKINGVDNGYDIVVEGKDAPKLQWAGLENTLRVSWREGAKLNILYQSGTPVITLGNTTVEVPPDAFLQASKQAQSIMIDLVVNAVKSYKNILDLFSGIGTYSFPLSEYSKVTAIEGDREMVKAMQAKGKIKAEARDLFANPVKAEALGNYDAIVINPPRAGAKAQTEQIASSKVKKVVMVSCNPATFARDARILKEGGYMLERLTPVDQFVYSSHLELVAEFASIK